MSKPPSYAQYRARNRTWTEFQVLASSAAQIRSVIVRDTKRAFLLPDEVNDLMLLRAEVLRVKGRFFARRGKA